MTWATTPLASVASVIRGVSFDGSEAVREPEANYVPILRAGNIKDVLDTGNDLVWVPQTRVSAEQLLRPNDIVIAMSSGSEAVVGKTARLDQPWHGSVGAFCAIIRPKREMHPCYLAMWLRGPEFAAWRLASCMGLNIKNLRRSDLDRVEIPFPSGSEQAKIAAILGRADDLRQQRRAADEKAQRVLSALFHKMFGDSAAWLDDTTAPLGRLVSPQGGGTPSKKKPEYWGGDVPWVSPKDMKRDFIDSAEDHITQMALDETNSHLVPVNSILVVVRGMILARYVPLAVNTAPVAINQDMKALTVTDPRVSPLYVFTAMKAMQQRLHANVSTAAHGTRKLDSDRLLSLPILVPNERKHGNFVRWFQQVRDIDERRATIAPRIERTFEVLLHRAFSGELTAGWREAHKDQLEAEMQEQLAALEQAKAGKPKRGRKLRNAEPADPAGNGRHAGTDMYNKAALVTYIAVKCHNPQRPDSLGRTKLAKLFYLVQRRAEISLTQQFARRAAGPLDDAIHKFLNLAKKQHWLTLLKPTGNLKPVVPGDNPQPAIDHVKHRWADALAVMDGVLDAMKGWGWEALERWATVENAAQQLAADGRPITLAEIKRVIAAEPEWRAKLDRASFSDLDIQRTLKGLRDHGYLPAEAGANP